MCAWQTWGSLHSLKMFVKPIIVHGKLAELIEKGHCHSMLSKASVSLNTSTKTGIFR